MSKQADLVLDSKLETIFDQDRPGQTGHVFVEADAALQRRSVRRVEWWQRQRCIGSGGCGTVYLERCISGQRHVTIRAVKTIPLSASQKRSKLYDRELEATSKFSQKRYEIFFVKSLGWFDHQDSLVIAMEYMQYGSLQDYLSYAPPMSEAEAAEISSQILEGLWKMHDSRFVHRDIKPADIMVQSGPPASWWVKIDDFGISKRVDWASDTTSTSVKGRSPSWPPRCTALGL
ncbi:kinase-like domain-containing protein [Lasiosphaeria miniovina]|uniref:Kinase-like domain-containing protein n=1 Tax=Lasiosphaeria miniovina TaxID=1954250 RepID=A0AA40B5B8_9PEZI|nr:kinase-like domain-containing protein [Lasiosphaeria miniovina]KAK0727966.1 kinase-like domain-containing protein [Lasiosphaeria miniovina]